MQRKRGWGSWRSAGRRFSSIAEGSSGSELRQISISSSTFRNIRQPDLIYVDKTRYLPQLISPTAQIFLSRPPKFGKSTLLSTIESVFMKNGPEKDKLFEGLWIKENCPKLLEKELPVLSLDLSTLRIEKGGDELEKSLLLKLQRIARVHDITLDGLDMPNSTVELVHRLSEKNKENKVVLLIDECDAPLTSVLGLDQDRALENRKILHRFFATLKALDRHIYFQMVTGVSRFHRTSLFSGAAPLRDITLSPAFSNVLGFTKSEIQTAFGRHLDALAQQEGIDEQQLWERITNWYNGYSWGGSERVYNPFSIGMLFTEKRLMSYWPVQASSDWLSRLLRPEDLKGLADSLNQVHPEESFASIEIESLGRSAFDTVSLLFQTGYLTIKEEQKLADGSRSIRLGLPNFEVTRYMTSKAFKPMLQGQFDYPCARGESYH